MLQEANQIRQSTVKVAGEPEDLFFLRILRLLEINVLELSGANLIITIIEKNQAMNVI
jgi:hypothetical protein